VVKTIGDQVEAGGGVSGEEGAAGMGEGKTGEAPGPSASVERKGAVAVMKEGEKEAEEEPCMSLLAVVSAAVGHAQLLFNLRVICITLHILLLQHRSARLLHFESHLSSSFVDQILLFVVHRKNQRYI